MAAPPLKKAVTNCREKRRYNEITAAQAAGLASCEKGGFSDLYVYRCESCRGLHLTRRRVNSRGQVNLWVFNFNGGVV